MPAFPALSDEALDVKLFVDDFAPIYVDGVIEQGHLREDSEWAYGFKALGNCACGTGTINDNVGTVPVGKVACVLHGIDLVDVEGVFYAEFFGFGKPVCVVFCSAQNDLTARQLGECGAHEAYGAWACDENGVVGCDVRVEANGFDATGEGLNQGSCIVRNGVGN